MRAKEFLTEKTNLSNIKQDIVNRVQATQDEDLLNKIYTALHKGGLLDRIGGTLQRDTDTKGYEQKLADIIIELPGTVEEKEAFTKFYPQGFIDINRMLSGEYVKFENLLTGGKGAPMEFVHRVFEALAPVTFGSAKGPGEFALAVLSPHIKITGKGDLNIGNQVVEVKAAAGQSGGRVGTPGLLKVDNIPAILNKHLPNPPEEGTSLNLTNLKSVMDANGLNPAQQKKLATELFRYIFSGTEVSDIVNAVVGGQDPRQYFLRANYALYQAESGFNGMMLINFPAKALKYFTDPIQMANEIYAMGIYLMSSNTGFSNRQILSQVTLKPVKEKATSIKLKPSNKKAVQ